MVLLYSAYTLVFSTNIPYQFWSLGLLMLVSYIKCNLKTVDFNYDSLGSRKCALRDSGFKTEE